MVSIYEIEIGGTTVYAHYDTSSLSSFYVTRERDQGIEDKLDFNAAALAESYALAASLHRLSNENVDSKVASVNASLGLLETTGLVATIQNVSDGLFALVSRIASLRKITTIDSPRDAAKIVDEILSTGVTVVTEATTTLQAQRLIAISRDLLKEGRALLVEAQTLENSNGLLSVSERMALTKEGYALVLVADMMIDASFQFIDETTNTFGEVLENFWQDLKTGVADAVKDIAELAGLNSRALNVASIVNEYVESANIIAEGFRQMASGSSQSIQSALDQAFANIEGRLAGYNPFENIPEYTSRFEIVLSGGNGDGGDPSAPPPPPPPATEPPAFDYGDTIATAFEVEWDFRWNDNTVGGSDPADVLRFAAGTDGVHTVAVSATGSMYISIFDGDGTFLKAADITEGTVDFDVEAGREYYVRFASNSENAVGYTIAFDEEAPQLSDYGIEGVEYSALEAEFGEELTVRYTVNNLGDIAAAGGQAVLALFDTETLQAVHLLDIEGFRTLEPGDTDPERIDFILSRDAGIAAGNYFIAVSLLVSDEDSEVSIANNISDYELFTVTDPQLTLPDVRLLNASLEDGTIVEGEAVNLSYTVDNAGESATTETVRQYIYISRDAQFNSNAELLDTDSAGRLSSGEVESETTNLSAELRDMGLGTGQFYLYVVADGGDDVEETVEGNNVSDPLSLFITPAEFTEGDDNIDLLEAREVFALGGNDRVDGSGGDDIIHGGDGLDNLDGGLGDDVLYGDAGEDNLDGEEGDDQLIGGAGNDRLFGDTGRDTLDGGAGNDFLRGDEGDDVLSGGDGSDDLRGSEGNDILFGDDGDDDLRGEDGNDRLDGGRGRDSLRGGAGDDILTGGDGDDNLSGGDGNDIIVGGNGDDDLSGGLGNNAYDGGSGTDEVELRNAASTLGALVDLTNGTIVTEFGSSTIIDVENVEGTLFDDEIYGTEAANEIDGEAGSDIIYGYAGDDDLEGRDGDDFIDGGAGNDTIEGDAGNDTLIGGSGNDTIRDNDGISIVDAGSGDDFIDTDSNADDIDAGEGNDIIKSSGGDDRIFAGLGDDIIDSSSGDDLVYSGAGNDSVEAGSGDDTVYGDAGNDVIDGERGDDLIFGGDGDDEILGGHDSDTLFGGSGSDTLRGGDDDDFLHIDGLDTVDGGTGYDRVYSRSGAISLDLGASTVEFASGAGGADMLDASTVDVTALGAQPVRLLGNGGNDTLIGSVGFDYIDGGSGNDVIDSGAGDDILDGSIGSDTFDAGAGDDILFVDSDDATSGSLDGGEGYDRIYVRGYAADATYDLSGGIEFASGNTSADTFDASAATWDVRLLGQGGDDILVGGSGNDQLFGSIGNDTLVGGEGKDLLNGSTGADTLTAGAGDDILFIDDLDIFVSGGAGYDRIYASGTSGALSLDLGSAEVEYASGTSANDTFDAMSATWAVKLLGREGNDFLTGGEGADNIFGGSGDDILIGGVGDDILHGQAGSDSFVYKTSDWGDDTIIGFEDGTDIIDMRESGIIFAELTIESAGANNVLVSFGDATILINGVNISDIDAADFLF